MQMAMWYMFLAISMDTSFLCDVKTLIDFFFF